MRATLHVHTCCMAVHRDLVHVREFFRAVMTHSTRGRAPPRPGPAPACPPLYPLRPAHSFINVYKDDK